MGVDELEREEEVLADGAPEAEVEERFERDVAVGGVDVAEDVDGLGTDVDAGLGVAAGVAERGAEDRDFDGALGGRAAADAGATDGLGYVELIVEGGDGGVVGCVGKEDARRRRGR